MDAPILIDEQILEFIPQRPPIVMVDKLFVVDLRYAVTGLTIKPDSIFIRDGVLSSMGLIEHLAQSASLGAGYNFVRRKIEVKIGFIGAIKDLIVYEWPEVGSELISEIRETHHISNIKIIEGRVKWRESVICSCEMKIFLQD